MKIGEHEITLSPIKINDGLEFDKDGKATKYVNKENEPCTKIQIAKAEFRWANKITGKREEGEIYKSYKSKPFAGFEKTEIITDFEVVDIIEMSTIVETTLTYLVSGDTLKAELKKLGKAFQFSYANSGSKRHDRTFVYFDPNLKKVFMKCSRGDLRDLNLNEKKTKKVKADSKIAKVGVDDV